MAKGSDWKHLQFHVLCTFYNVFYRSKKHVLMVFFLNLQINVFNIYATNLEPVCETLEAAAPPADDNDDDE